MNCPACTTPMKKVAQKVEASPHLQCLNCSGHHYKGEWFSAEEWFYMVNGLVFQTELESDHAHEIINHNDPEVL